MSDRTTALSFYFLLALLVLSVLGPSLAPYGYDERVRTDDGGILRLAEPSAQHPLGTNDVGYDIFSRMLYGVAPTVVTGLVGAVIIITIGTSIGLTAGYVGGRVGEVLMRLTDVAYGVPLIPFAIVLLGLFEFNYYESVLVISMVLWRGCARVLRAQVLSIKERPYILAVKATGASTPYIILRHILPNVAAIAVLFFALNVGYVIIIQAGLAFLGVMNPFVPSWGIIIRNAYAAGYMIDAWWWAVPPGLAIAMTVLSTFMLGRGYETLIGHDEEAITRAG